MDLTDTAVSSEAEPNKRLELSRQPVDRSDSFPTGATDQLAESESSRQLADGKRPRVHLRLDEKGKKSIGQHRSVTMAKIALWECTLSSRTLHLYTTKFLLF